MQQLKNIIHQSQDSYIPQATKTTPSHSEETVGNTYDFNTCIHLLNNKGKEIYGENFSISENDYPIIFKLIVYMTNDVNNAQKHGLNLQKGILLTGPVGCGKTTLMHLVSYFLPTANRYIMRPCRDISFEFSKDGYDTIHKYSKASFTKHGMEYRKPITYCFDDLGIENNLKYYGNDTNVMAEILLSRYDLFVSKGMLTHCTTNLSADEIENAYGNRVRSRMRSMFNLIAFDNTVKDKRS